MRCNGTQSRAFLCSPVKEGEEIRCLVGEIALADGEKSVESGREQRRRETVIHISQSTMSHRRRLGWVTQTLFILLISQMIRMDLDAVHTRFVFIGGFSFSIRHAPWHDLLRPDHISHEADLFVFFTFEVTNRKELHRKTYNRRKERGSMRQKIKDTLPTVRHVESS